MMTSIQDRLDYFGRTVHVGAQLVGEAGRCELVVSDDVARDAAVSELLSRSARPLGVLQLGPIVATRISAA
jgi:class 3 adenylate cyclase